MMVKKKHEIFYLIYFSNELALVPTQYSRNRLRTYDEIDVDSMRSRVSHEIVLLIKNCFLFVQEFRHSSDNLSSKILELIY
jgi:hypothetical protein